MDVVQLRSDHLPMADGASVPDKQPSLHFLRNLPANNVVVLHNRERSNNTTEANVDTGPHAGTICVIPVQDLCASSSASPGLPTLKRKYFMHDPDLRSQQSHFGLHKLLDDSHRAAEYHRGGG